jgi:hypothetical protein
LKVSSVLKERRKTGGGESEAPTLEVVEEITADVLSVYEQKLVKIIGIESIAGIVGGCDTSCTTPTISNSANSPTEVFH